MKTINNSENNLENNLINKTIAIIPCSGTGKRMNLETPKQFLEINEKPIICYTIEKFEKCELIDEIILVTNKDYIDFVKSYIVENYNYNKVTEVVIGGKERIFSVYNGINSIKNPKNEDIIIIHDGVRPFVSIEDIEKIIKKTKEKKACVLGVKCKDTIKLCKEKTIVRTPVRDNLWLAQTPQCFEYKIIKNAYDNAIEKNVLATDDASLVELLDDIKVSMVEGSYNNLKITTQEDLNIFKYLNL